MLRMLIWTLSPVCCVGEGLVDEGWHRGEHDGNTSFRPQLELQQAQAFIISQIVLDTSPVILDSDLSAWMRLINISNVDTHLPSDIAITGQRGSCLHFLQSAFCRSLQQAWMAGALLLSSHWQLAQGVKAWSLRNSKLVHFLLSIYTKMLYSVAALLVCTLLLVAGLSIHRHWFNLISLKSVSLTDTCHARTDQDLLWSAYSVSAVFNIFNDPLV